MLFLVSIESIIPIIALIALGYILQKRGWFQDSFGNDLSKLIQSATPALVGLLILAIRETAMLNSRRMLTRQIVLPFCNC